MIYTKRLEVIMRYSLSEGIEPGCSRCTEVGVVSFRFLAEPFQWCLKAEEQEDLQPLKHDWRASASVALSKAEAQLARIRRTTFKNIAHKKGSSRITGEDALDLHKKEFAIPVTVRHSLDDLYSIVYSFQLTGVHRPANPTYDAPPVSL